MTWYLYTDLARKNGSNNSFPTIWLSRKAPCFPMGYQLRPSISSVWPKRTELPSTRSFPNCSRVLLKLFAGFGFNRNGRNMWVGVACCLLVLPAPYFFTAALGIGFEPPACARWKKALVSSDYIHWFNIHWLCSIPLHLLLSEHQSGWVSGNSSREFGYSVANHFLNCHLALRFLS